MILDVIVEDKKKRLVEHKQKISEDEMKKLALASDRKSISFYNALAKKGLSIIGEFKKASPSHGKMNSKVDLDTRIKQYNASVDAISCLTEEDHFNGSVEYLKQIRSMTKLPIIRKDFIIEAYQVYEAKVIGADAILLIAAILDDGTFKRLYELAYSLGLDVLCEVHDEEELKRMINLDVKIIGINNRNLKTFEVSLDITKQLANMIPEGKVIVSESGVLSNEDILTLKESGANALLIGTALMESDCPELTAKTWKNIYKIPQIKICGITDKKEIEYLIENKVEYDGMVLFFEQSKRCIDIDIAKEIINTVNKKIKTVAVTVSPTAKQLKLIEEAGFDYIQIHGELSKEVYESCSLPIIRAFNVKADIKDIAFDDIKLDKIKAILFDASVSGDGKIFNWNIIENIDRKNKKLILAGGLNSENVKEAIEKIGPDIVDVSSAVEYDNAKGKDPEKIKNFVNAVREYK